MAEKKGVGHAYNVDFLNMVFAASSLFLFLSIIWMVWDDYDREWKTTQRRFAQLEYRVTQAQLQETTTGLDRNKLQQLEAARQAAEKIVAANQEEVDELEAALKAADARLYRATVDYQYAKATYDQDRYDFEASRANKTPGTSKTEPVVEHEAKALADLNLQVEQITAEKGELQRQLAQYTGQPEGWRRRRGEGNADSRGGQRRLVGLPEIGQAVRRGEGAPAGMERRPEADRARAPGDHPVRLLQLPRHQRVREDPTDRH